MQEEFIAEQRLSVGQLVVCSKNGKVRPVAYDSSLKARITRWFGGKLNNAEWQEYGVKPTPAIGVATGDSVENKRGEHFVQIEIGGLG